MSSEQIRQSVRNTGRIISAQGHDIDPADVITKACRIFGERSVMEAMTLPSMGDDRSHIAIGRMCDEAIRAIIDDIELEMRE